MNLNLLLVIMAVVLICMVMDGYKKGMVKSLISLISLLITCVVLFLIGNGLSSYFDGKIFNVILTIPSNLSRLCTIGSFTIIFAEKNTILRR